jgi:hypothetical protein
LDREEVETGRKGTEKRRKTLENEQELRRVLVTDFSSTALVTREWLVPEYGESQIVSEDRGCRPGRLRKCIG